MKYLVFAYEAGSSAPNMSPIACATFADATQLCAEWALEDGDTATALHIANVLAYAGRPFDYAGPNGAHYCVEAAHDAIGPVAKMLFTAAAVFTTNPDFAANQLARGVLACAANGLASWPAGEWADIEAVLAEAMGAVGSDDVGAASCWYQWDAAEQEQAAVHPGHAPPSAVRPAAVGHAQH